MSRPSPWSWPKPPLLQPLRALSGSAFSYRASGLPPSKAGAVVKIAVLGFGESGPSLHAPDGRAANGGRPGVAHIWNRLRIG